MAKNWKINGDKSLFNTVKVNSFVTIGYSEFIQSYLWAANPCIIADMNDFIREASKTAVEGETPDVEHFRKAYITFAEPFFISGGTIEIW